MDYIDLSRRFRDLTESELESPELLASLNDARWAAAAGMSVGWAEILQHPRVVVLAEAGSGKTAEMQAQTARLRAEGQPAFFIELERLQRPLAEILSCEDNRALDAWKAEGQSTAWFFLDAADELKLVQGKLKDALIQFAKGIDGHLHRAYCVISCRPSDFRRSIDLAAIRSQLPFMALQPVAQPDSDEAFLAPLREPGTGGATKEKASISGEPRTLVLLPLSKDQISTFVRSQGVTDAAALIDEVNRRDAWIFARRPGDLINLIALWKASGRLGTRAQQHEANVRAQLADKPDRPDHGVLSDDQARIGAERLALALVLTRARTIRAPEQEPGTERAEGMLDAAAILIDWTPQQRQSLLRRALFDPATYGRVRFHHRSVQEYLAAKRIAALRQTSMGMSAKSLRRLLFAERYSMNLVIPSMQAIAAWLALWDDDVRREMMAREPETLLSMGDSESLAVRERTQLLRAFVELYSAGGWRGLGIHSDRVQQFADPALGRVVRELWNSKPSSPDVTELLLEIIWKGSIAECSDIAHAAAFDASQRDTQRVFAIRALATCSRTESLQELRDSILSESENWPERVVGAVAKDLFPNALSVSDLITLIQMRNKPKRSTNGFSWAMREIIEEIDPLSATADDLREKLTNLIWEARHRNLEWYRLQSRFDHIAPALALLCDRQLEATASLHAPDERLIWSSVVANRFGRDKTEASDLIQGLRRRFKSRPALRKAAFWNELKLTIEATQTEDSFDQYHRSMHYGLLDQPAPSDRSWLLKALQDSQVREDRLAALHALISLWIWEGKKASSFDEVMDAVRDDEGLIAILRQRSTPSESDLKLEEWQREERQRKLEREERERQRIENWIRWKQEFLADPDAAFSTENQWTTINHIYMWLERRQRRANRYTVWDEAALRSVLGPDIAARSAKSFCAIWRQYPPTPRSHRPADEQDSTLRVWTHEGLAGLAAESSTPDWAARLSSEEARIAAAYATIGINEFPGWVKDLAVPHPAIVDEVIGGELTAELTKDEGHSYLPTLQYLTQADASLKQLLAPRLLDWLPRWPLTFQNDQCSRQSALHLGQALGILHDAIGFQERATVAELCSRRFSENPNGLLALTWLRGLFRFDPEQATQAFEAGLAYSPDQERSGRAIATFGDLFGHRGLALAFADDKNRASCLGRLVRCAYTYVLPAEDQEHEGAYTPDVRDDAERARNFLLMALLDTPGAEAHEVVLALIKDPLFADYRDRLLLLERERAARDTEGPAFTAEEVVALEKRFEMPPNDRDSLFACMMHRLDDLAHDLAHHEFTIRRTLQTINDETEMQRNLARNLLDAAKGAYKVSREEEVADLKKPDIRLATARGDQNAAIEVKIADNWTLTELEGALRNQLVAQYLRHDTCRAGCLLLSYHGRRKIWSQSSTRRRLRFTEVIEHLRALAQSIERERSYEIKLGVCPLDLTNPLSKSGPGQAPRRSQPERSRRSRRGRTKAKPKRNS
ncbi:MAG TPA: hypothetical protein VF173_36545 [Thermoanaerobaculia bacterium]|nr:hypothetical protein [Thermoanaerobaculia bacterium]